MQAIMVQILLILVLLGHSASLRAQSVQEGVLDLQAWVFEAEPLIPLRGNWEFYWSQLLSPFDFLTGMTEGREWMRVPGSWSLVTKHPTMGVANYRLRVLLKEPRKIAMHSPWILS